MTVLSDNFRTVYEDQIHRTRERAASFIEVAHAKRILWYVDRGRVCPARDIAKYHVEFCSSIRRNVLKWCETRREMRDVLRAVQAQIGKLGVRGKHCRPPKPVPPPRDPRELDTIPF